MRTKPEPAEHVAARAINDGQLVIFPTETVYALAANGLDPQAKKKIYDVKGRDFSKPLQLLLADTASLHRFIEADSLTEPIRKILRKFWPGPLTVVFKASPLGTLLSGGPTIGIRVPDHPLAQDILRSCPVPVLATSANKSAGEEPVSGRQVPPALKKTAKCVIMEPGKTQLAAPSTVFDVSSYPPKILREGAISAKEIAKLLP